MTRLSIKNIGPIKETHLTINTVNIFMGPQSSGKSTIAKLISYCSWVEKDVVTNLSYDKYLQDDTFVSKLISYHKMKGYLDASSYIHYRSKIIDIKYSKEKVAFRWINKYAYKRNKIAYIPSERNMVTMPELEKLELPLNNIRSFLFDWFSARKCFDVKNAIEILNLGVNYYYSDDVRESHIKALSTNSQYDILLSNASSGLQSLIPLHILVEYLTKWIYTHDEELSFDERVKRNEIDVALFSDLVLFPYALEQNISITKENVKDVLQSVIARIKDDKQLSKRAIEWEKIRRNFSRNIGTQFIIEEPEQNLFPETQRDFIYYLLKRCFKDNIHKNNLTITTHSPYILYSINNCLLGFLCKKKIPQSEKKQMLSKDAWINPKNVSVWEIIDEGELKGTLRRIQDADGIISENYFDIKMTELTNEYYEILNYFNNEE